MKYLWIIAAVIATALTKTCDPATITVEIFKDKECKVKDKKATTAFGTMSKTMYSLFSKDCKNHSKADCTDKAMVIKGWKNAECKGDPTGTYKIEFGKCKDKRKYTLTAEEDEY